MGTAQASHGHRRHHQRSRRCPDDLKLYILEACSQNTDTESNVDATETGRGIIEPSGCVTCGMEVFHRCGALLFLSRGASTHHSKDQKHHPSLGDFISTVRLGRAHNLLLCREC